MSEALKQHIKETIERGEPCHFKQTYIGRDYCYLLVKDACRFQGPEEFVAGLMTNRTRFKGCYLDGDWRGV